MTVTMSRKVGIRRVAIVLPAFPGCVRSRLAGRIDFMCNVMYCILSYESISMGVCLTRLELANCIKSLKN